MTGLTRSKSVFTGQTLSPAAAKIAREMKLYPVARRVTYCTELVRNYRDNLALRKGRPDFAFPPERLLYVTQPTTSYRVYLNGKDTARKFHDIAAQHLGKLRRVYEWGSGTGSMIRHMPDIDPSIQAYGSDYDPRLVEWCRANIPKVRFSLNSLEPPLPFDDETFDFVYSRSVYTHLSAELQQIWLADQLRVTRPGGLVLLTVHGDAYKHRLTKREIEHYDTTGFVEHGSVADGGPWFTSFNSPDYMERTLLSGLEIVYRELLPEEARGRSQDKWMVRKPT